MDEKRTISLSRPDVTDLEKKEVLEVLDSPCLTQGEKIEEFEKKISDFINVPYVIGVNSGTSALHLIVKSLGLKEGDEVITTPFSFIASANCLLMEGVKPVFVDIDEESLNIDVNLIEEKITSKTKAILPVHIFGYPVDMERINEIAKKHNLAIIEDACEAIGTEYNNERVGRKSDAAVFAFYPNKQITTGEGGVIVTSNEEIARLCRSMRNQGRNDKGDWLDYERLGYNYRLDEMSAALGISQMERIDEILQKREDVANMYLEKLKNVEGVKLPPTSLDVKISWFAFTIRVDEKYRDSIIKFLDREGIASRDYFPPIHLFSFYKESFGYSEGDFPVTEKASKQTITLPFHTKLTEDEIDYVVAKLKEAIVFVKK